MARAMIFIDGSWLYQVGWTLAEIKKQDFRIDYGKLPSVLANAVAERASLQSVEVARTYLFGSYPENVDEQDWSLARKRVDFFSMLKRQFHYEVEVFPIDYHGNRLRSEDRDPTTGFIPREKCVDLAMASEMLAMAAMPAAYDIAIGVLGDRDFMPVLKHVRRFGKRVAIVSQMEHCAAELSDPVDEQRVKDFDVIWLDSLMEQLALKYEEHSLECQSPFHKGDRKVMTTYYPRPGQRFYCETCRAEYARRITMDQNVTPVADRTPVFDSRRVGERIVGKISNLKNDFGFISADDGESFYFRFVDAVGVRLEIGELVEAKVFRLASADRSGAVNEVKSLKITQ